MCNCWSNNKY